MTNIQKCPAQNNQAANYWMNQNPVSDKEFIQFALDHLESYPESVTKILNTTIMLSYKHKTVWAAQETIAEMSNNYSRKTANVALGILHKLGIITMVYRGKMRTCIYIINPFFKKNYVVKKLRDKLPALKFFLAISILASSSSFSEKVTQQYIGDKEMRESSLLALPEEARSFATKVFKRNIRDVKNRLHYIMTVGLNYCKRHNLKVDWALSAQLSELGDNSSTHDIDIKTSFTPEMVEQLELANPYQGHQIVRGEIEPGTSLSEESGGEWILVESLVDGQLIPESEELCYVYDDQDHEEMPPCDYEDLYNVDDVTDEYVKDFFEE